MIDWLNSHISRSLKNPARGHKVKKPIRKKRWNKPYPYTIYSEKANKKMKQKKKQKTEKDNTVAEELWLAVGTRAYWRTNMNEWMKRRLIHIGSQPARFWVIARGSCQKFVHIRDSYSTCQTSSPYLKPARASPFRTILSWNYSSVCICLTYCFSRPQAGLAAYSPVAAGGHNVLKNPDARYYYCCIYCSVR